jgi:SprT protein
MTEAGFVEKMSRYMPAEAATLVYRWLGQHPARLRITMPRASKLGDFRVDPDHPVPMITVNGNLNPYSFTITMVHEVAHLFDYKKRDTLRDAHGTSWKVIYSQLLEQMLNTGIFPAELRPAIMRHLRTCFSKG